VESDLATDILASLRALGGELGGEVESIINGIAEKHSVLAVRAVAMGAGASEHALLFVTLDDGRLYLANTGSQFTIISEWECQRLYNAGHASKKLKKSRNTSFVCAAGNDLGYINDTIVTLLVADARRPARTRIFNNHDGFPSVMGIDTLTARDGIINTRK
jgi:hypothetical protein